MQQPEEVMEAVREAREVGELEAMLEDQPRYILFAHRLLPNGSTGEFVKDPEVAREIGRKAGIGDPTDGGGWGIWVVP